MFVRQFDTIIACSVFKADSASDTIIRSEFAPVFFFGSVTQSEGIVREFHR